MRYKMIDKKYEKMFTVITEGIIEINRLIKKGVDRLEIQKAVDKIEDDSIRRLIIAYSNL